MIPFAKWQGCGNDFVLLQVDDLKKAGLKAGLTPEQICSICDRKFGVGSDGLITLERTEKGLICLMWNPDGSRSGMCGNGIRCAARFSQAKGLWEDGVPFWMSDRLMGIKVLDGQVKVAMGLPSGNPWDPSQVELPPSHLQLNVQGSLVEAWGVSFGNPHLVVVAPNLAEVDLHRLGPALEKHPDLPGSTNAHFVQVRSRTQAEALHWERGAGATLGCGSGASAIFAVLRSLGLCETPLQLTLPGGILILSEDEQGIHKLGPASESFTGWIEI